MPKAFLSKNFRRPWCIVSSIQSAFFHPALFILSLDFVFPTEIMSENRKEGMVI